MGVLTYKDGTWFFVCKFEERHLPDKAGFKWDVPRACWATHKLEIAEKLAQYANEIAERKLLQRKTSYDKSYALNSTIELPCPAKESYDPHQKAAAEWIISREVSLIADPPGAGKTIEFMAAANYLAERVPLFSALIVCPSTAVFNWEAEIKKWATFDHTCQIITKNKQQIDPHVTIVVTTYGLLANNPEKFLRPYTCVVFDESHFIKNYKAKRTKACIHPSEGVARLSQYKIFMTGTPCEVPIDLYPLLKWQSPETIVPYDDWFKYVRRYCGAYQGKFGLVTTGTSHEEDLNHRLRSTVMLRRDKEKIITNLPPKRIVPVFFEPDGTTKKIIKQEWDTLPLADIEKELEYDRLSVKNVALIAKFQIETAKAIMDEAIKFIEETLEVEDKVVVFAFHKEIIQQIAERLKKHNPVVITGETPPQKRKEAQDKFQEDKNCRVFVGNVVAAGVNLTLTKSKRVIFLETNWVFRDIEQPMDRCHRRGQKDFVLGNILVVKGSIQEHMLKIVLKKMDAINKIVR